MSKGKRRPRPRPQVPNSPVLQGLAYPAPVPPRAPDDMYTISIHVLSDHSATVAKTSYSNIYNMTPPLHASGSAKREPGDLYDQETGRLLATSRALEALAAKLGRQARGRIRNAAAVKGHREEIRRRAVSGDPRKPRPGEMTMQFKLAGPLSMHVPPPKLSPGEQRLAEEYFPKLSKPKNSRQDDQEAGT